MNTPVILNLAYPFGIHLEEAAQEKLGSYELRGDDLINSKYKYVNEYQLDDNVPNRASLSSTLAGKFSSWFEF